MHYIMQYIIYETITNVDTDRIYFVCIKELLFLGVIMLLHILKFFLLEM